MYRLFVIFFVVAAGFARADVTGFTRVELREAVVSPGVAQTPEAVYVFGGATQMGEATKMTDHVQRISRTNGQVEILDVRLPEAVAQPGIAVFGGKIYGFGGTVGQGRASTSAWVFEPSSETIRTLHALPAPRASVIALAAEDMIILMGGYGQCSTGCPRIAATTLRYDIARDAYEEDGSSPLLAESQVVRIGAETYLIGGFRAETGKKGPSEAIWRTTDVLNVSLVANLSGIRPGSVAVAEGNDIVLLGGLEMDGAPSRGSLRWNMTSFVSEFQDNALPEARAYAGIADDGDGYWIVGGIGCHDAQRPCDDALTTQQLANAEKRVVFMAPALFVIAGIIAALLTRARQGK